MKSKIVLCVFLSTSLIACKTIQKDKQSEKVKQHTEVHIESDSTSSFRDKSQSSFKTNEQTGTWTFEEWYRADADADTVIRPAFFPLGYPNVPDTPKEPAKGGDGWNYRKATFTNSNKSTEGESKKDISLDKSASNTLDSIADNLHKTDNKTVVSTPNYGWVLPCLGVIVLVCFVAYIWYRKTRPVAKVIRMVPNKNYTDI